MIQSESKQEEAYQCFIEGNYEKAAALYEQTIASDPTDPSNYWYVGLCLLLQGQEAEAQTTWLLAMSEAEPEDVEEWAAELVKVLETEAERRETIADIQLAWAIRRHLREVVPERVDNLLKIMQLSIKLDTLSEEELESLEITPLLRSSETGVVEPALLLQTLQELLEYAPRTPLTLEFAEATLKHASDLKSDFVYELMTVAIKQAYRGNYYHFGTHLAELCLQLEPEDLGALGHLVTFYQRSDRYEESIAVAKKYYSLVQTLPGKAYGGFLMLKALVVAGGSSQEAYTLLEEHLDILKALVEQHPLSLDQGQTLSLFTTTFFLPYLRDDLAGNRWFHNQIAKLCQDNIQVYAKEHVEKFAHRSAEAKLAKCNSSKKLKIGYISGCLRRHSVGWLARWLFQHHDRDRFDVYTYFINSPSDAPFSQRWFVSQSTQANFLGIDGIEAAEAVYQDQIDILVDLDSISLDTTCEAMALKPAPIQATWLGWDGSGLPAIDYFLADPYVLPDTAEAHYAEKVWRLPHTYIAVDGFEVDVPTLRRSHLDIPDESIIYLSSQKGQKRHPETTRHQMQILQAVPNSYFLIKGGADEERIKTAFKQAAEEEGVDPSRLRFLSESASEATHRANLSIADIVLDTYPYNGATTTLETLWMGIPLVTRVGQHFSSRNSYGMMMNAGVTEGIAYTAEEYINWGIRLGTDSALREQITWKLRLSRRTSPLWNAAAFTRDMEQAYEQMWALL